MSSSRGDIRLPIDGLSGTLGLKKPHLNIFSIPLKRLFVKSLPGSDVGARFM